MGWTPTLATPVVSLPSAPIGSTPLPSGATTCPSIFTRPPDYKGVSVEVSLPLLIMLTGLGLSEIGLPEVGLPVALVGGVLETYPWTSPLAIGGAIEWDRYGHYYVSGQVSWGHAWPEFPLAMNVYGVRIFTEDNCPATEEEVTQFIPGFSLGIGASALYGGGVVWNPDFGKGFPGTFGLQTGWAFPLQIGGAASIAFQVR